MSDASAKGTSIVSRAISIIVSPDKEWPAIAAEDTTSSAIFKGYVLPLALIGPLCGFVGGRLFGTAFYGPLAHPGVFSQLGGALFVFLITLISYVLLCAIAEGLAPRFGGKVGSIAATKLVAYGSTPMWLCGLFSLVPSLTPLSILSLYGIYLIYKGAGPVMEVPKDKQGSYTVALVLCALVLNVVVAALSATNVAIMRDMGLAG